MYQFPICVFNCNVAQGFTNHLIDVHNVRGLKSQEVWSFLKLQVMFNNPKTLLFQLLLILRKVTKPEERKKALWIKRIVTPQHSH